MYSVEHIKCVTGWSQATALVAAWDQPLIQFICSTEYFNPICGESRPRAIASISRKNDLLGPLYEYLIPYRSIYFSKNLFMMTFLFWFLTKVHLSTNGTSYDILPRQQPIPTSDCKHLKSGGPCVSIGMEARRFPNWMPRPSIVVSTFI